MSFRSAVASITLLGALVVGCTAAELSLAKTIVDDSGAVCETVFVAADPTLTPLCVTAATIAQAIESLVAANVPAASDAGAPAGAHRVGAAAPAAFVPTNAQIYGWLVAHGAKPVEVASLPQQAAAGARDHNGSVRSY